MEERPAEPCPEGPRTAYAKSGFAGRANMTSGTAVGKEPMKATVPTATFSEEEVGDLAVKAPRAKTGMLTADRRADAMRALDEAAAELIGRTRV